MKRPTVPDIIVAAIILATVAFFAWPRSEWPKVVGPDNAAPVVRRHSLGWKKTPIEQLDYFRHDPHGLYLHRGPIVACKPGEDEVDAEPHPSRVVHCGLKAYGVMIETEGRSDEVRLYADRLISLQDDVGLFRFRAGNVSAQTQGKGLSLLARAYRATKDTKYLVAGRKALDATLLPVTGGVRTSMFALDPSLRSYIFFDKTKPEYVLNEHMFVLIGLYDWSKVATEADYGQDIASDYFERGMDTLTHVLPYYDLGGISCYDLGFIHGKPMKVGAVYHMLHIRQLHALYDMTRQPLLKQFETKWTGYLTKNPAWR